MYGRDAPPEQDSEQEMILYHRAFFFVPEILFGFVFEKNE